MDLAALGWDPATVLRGRRRDLRPGRVARVDTGVCTVFCVTGTVRATLSGRLFVAAARDRSALPGTGDWVLLGTWPDGRVTVEAVLPRRTALPYPADGRTGPAGLLAANVDVAAVVLPVHPAPAGARVAALVDPVRAAGVPPVVILTKTDLTADTAAIAARVHRAVPGVPVLPVSVRTGRGLPAVRDLVPPGRTLALLGPAGAGKSALVDALAGASVLGVGAARRADGGRRPGGSCRALVRVPGGGAVIDTPGGLDFPVRLGVSSG
ncbi:GTPase RsgA [Micromonospora echinofusca]|uniref:GTPase RsgA n=1 Tax=Micromonospora echinofusca TaxID=47858 RepID=A0ABS3VYN1_MICEH|nr:GTPase RsgA [Micromonospora echinofusca]MBO4209646.1 GTPase RsgA [Micromonospora echinofusca]